MNDPNKKPMSEAKKWMLENHFIAWLVLNLVIFAMQIALWSLMALGIIVIFYWAYRALNAFAILP